MQCPYCYGMLEVAVSVKADDVVTCDGRDCGHAIIDGQKAWQCKSCALDFCNECTESAGGGGRRPSKPPAKWYAARPCAPAIPIQPLHINVRGT